MIKKLIFIDNTKIIKLYKYTGINVLIEKYFLLFKNISIFQLKYLYFDIFMKIKKNKKKINILIFNMYKLKPNLIYLDKNKCKLNLSTGIILKKLELNEKNLKKDLKIINYMIKLTFYNLDIFYKNYNFIINIIGLNKNYFRILKFFKKNSLTKNNFYLLNKNENINCNKYKKKKSIKKKFIKKNLKN